MLSLVLPTYNEASNIAVAIQSIERALKGYDFEIIVADDDSPDQTWKVAEDLNNPRVRVLRRTSERGLSPAVYDGLSIAKGDRFGVMDADLQHDEKILPVMLKDLDNFEMVIGSRAVQGGSYGKFTLYRKFTSWVAAQLARLVLGISIADPMAGYFLMRREVFERAKPKMSPKGFKILLEIFCCAYPVSFKEQGFVFRTRRDGESKLTASVMAEYLQSLFELKRKMYCCEPKKV